MNNISSINLFKSFSHENEAMPVLENISFTVSKGDKIAITGASGAGKSTLLQLLAGLDKPTKGQVCVDGVDIHSMNALQQSRLRLDAFGFVYQFHHLLEDLNVFENILLPQQLQNINTLKDSKKKVDSVIDQLGLTSRATHLPWKLSGGEKQRVAIARAIVNNPEYLFCDEPNSGLDPKTAIIIDNLIKEITTEYNIITVINSHDMNSVMEIGDKIIFLKDGLKEWEGSKENIFKTDNTAVTDFVYSSKLYRKIRETFNK